MLHYLPAQTLTQLCDVIIIAGKLLTSVDASVNPISKLPESFTQLINLEELYLNDTLLEFLPADLGRLTKLRVLELRENHLKTLPKSMTRLTQLVRVDIGQNDFVDMVSERPHRDKSIINHILHNR